ncbi:MAG: MFS transporter [Actinobacteria bacterium]|nr:MFS transporter [Actinomycetota bacterium]MBW3650234.1 MFS transporter [Actinomycetota bacterium]
MDVGAGWGELRPTHPPGNVRISGFAGLTLTHALSTAGDALVTMALAGSLFFSISPNAARGRVALSLVLSMAPFAVVAPFLGPAIDRSRHGRRAMVVASCAGRALACLMMVEVLQGLGLFPLAFAVLVLAKGYSVAKSSLVPALVARAEDLVEANAKLAITAAVAGFVAAGPGLLVLRFFGAEWVLRLAAVVFVAGAVAGGRLRARAAPSSDLRAADTSAEALGTGSEIRLSGAAVVMALLRAVVGFLTFLVAFDLRRTGAPTWWFGLVLAASVASGLAGSVLAPRLRRKVSEERILTGCLLLVAGVGLVTARLEGRLWAAAVAAAAGLAAGSAKLAFDSLVQRTASDAARSGSFARFEAGFQLVWVVGALLPVLVATPLRRGYDVVGVATLAAAVAYAAFRRRVGTTWA